MKHFLRETWEIWYWAMFCPSKLQERMDTCGQGSSTPVKSLDILLGKPNGRFVLQYLIVIICLSLPIAILALAPGVLTSGLLFLFAVLSAYSISLGSIFLGINLPLFFALVYKFNANNYTHVLNQNLNHLKDLYQDAPTLWVALTGLILSMEAIQSKWRFEYNRFSKITFVLLTGYFFSTILYFAEEPIGLAVNLAVTETMIFFLYSIINNTDSGNDHIINIDTEGRATLDAVPMKENASTEKITVSNTNSIEDYLKSWSNTLNSKEVDDLILFLLGFTSISAIIFLFVGVLASYGTAAFGFAMALLHKKKLRRVRDMVSLNRQTQTQNHETNLSCPQLV
jgi:hypothetical protein